MLLAIATAHARCSAALIDRGEVVAAMSEDVGRGHAERLVPLIGELAAGRARPDRIAVDVGPGSHTGVRVGLAAASALGLAWGAPVAGVAGDALVAARAFALEPDLVELWVLLDARRGRVYARRHARGAGAPGVVRVLEDAVMFTELAGLAWAGDWPDAPAAAGAARIAGAPEAAWAAHVGAGAWLAATPIDVLGASPWSP